MFTGTVIDDLIRMVEKRQPSTPSYARERLPMEEMVLYPAVFSRGRAAGQAEVA